MESARAWILAAACATACSAGPIGRATRYQSARDWTPPATRRRFSLVGVVDEAHTSSALRVMRKRLAQDRRPEPSRTVTIPFLASRTNPSELDFMAAQCDVAPTGEEMACRFRQLFLTISAIDPKSCVITTSGYEQTFRRTAAARWVSEGQPDGACGRVETATLEDGGGTRWTLTLRTAATRTEQPQCRALPENVEVYDWTNVKRPLPCSSIQPGAIER